MSKKFKKPKPLLVDRNNETLVAQPEEPEPRPFRLAVCVPCRDEVKASFCMDLAAMIGYSSVVGVAQRQLELVVLHNKGTLIASQRHQLVVDAIRHECDGILWLDADMRFPQDTIFRLMSHNEKIVAANYSTRAGHPANPVAFKNMTDESPVAFDYVWTTPESTGLEAVDSVGMGVMFTHMEVFMSLRPPAFFIPWHPVYGGYLGEDVFFCERAREAGFKVWIDHDLSKEVHHVGEKEYDVLRDAYVDAAEAQAKKDQKYERWLAIQTAAKEVEERANNEG